MNEPLIATVRKVVRVHSGEEFEAADFPTLEDGYRANAALDDLRALLIEADAYVSHMHHRGSWPGTSFDVERLIGRLRREA